MTDVVTVIDGLDLVVALADGHVHPDDVSGARSEAAAVRARHGHLGRTLVVALVGGTGSGKSSLLNALAGRPIAEVGARRPTTSEPLAWIPEDAEPSLPQLLDRIGVHRRITQTAFPGLALVDMMDVDSLETSHRDRVEELLPEVDGLIWVLDPVKYRDHLIHRELVAPLADSAEQFLFVLNKVDQLDDDQVRAVIDDLRAALFEDGIERPRIFPLAADPEAGARVGVDRLAAHLRERMDTKRIQLAGVLADVRRSARALAVSAGVRRGGSLAFEERWGALVEASAAALALGGGGRGVVEEVLCGLEDFVGHLSAEAGGPFGMRLRYRFTPERIEREVDAVTEEVAAAGGDPSKAAAVAAEALQRRLGAPMREVVWERASLAASMAGLVVDVANAEAALAEEAPG
ncbi:MAG: GTPase [Acidimicrobiia bacterium]|nr:GTPase [Acidimicrobiia bacterium]